MDCAAVDHPEQFSGFDLVTVLGLDLRGGAVDPLPAAAVVAGAGTVYASTSTLYVTTERWPQAGADARRRRRPRRHGRRSGRAPESPPSPVDPTTTSSAPSTTTTTPPPPTTTVPPSTTAPPATEPTPDDTSPPDLEANGPYTDVHAFAIGGDDAAQYLASGRVRGTVLDQFSLSEHEGRLRIATTVTPNWWGWSMPTSRETHRSLRQRELRDRAGAPRRRAGPLGEVGGLGRNEQIYSTRFVGDQAYVVTFRRTDPLYVVDLRDPAAPRVAGELKVNGYSSYLQLIGEGRLLGVGQDGTDDGRLTGFAESLFDVCDPSAPTRLAQLSLPRTLPRRAGPPRPPVVGRHRHPRRAAGDVGSPSRCDFEQGVVVTTVTDDGIVERGRVSTPATVAPPGRPRPPARRTPSASSPIR